MATVYMRRLIALALVLASLLALVGCGDSETLPADQVLQKAAPAMKAANSFHFTLDTSKPDKPVTGIFISKADGDVAKPDKLRGDLSATFGGLPINIKVVVDGKNQYMTDPASGKWSSMGSALNVMQFFDPSKGVSDILAGVKNPTSDGKESIDGTDCYRIKATVPAAALKSLSPEVTAQADLGATLWIASSDFFLRQVRLGGPLMSTEPSNLVRTISFKDYNKDIKIETPVVGK